MILKLLLQQSITSRSERQIKRNKRKPGQLLMMCGFLKQPSETLEGFYVVLVKKKRYRKKEIRKKEFWQLWKKRKTDWLRGKSRKKVFIFLLILSFPSFLFLSSYIYHSFPTFSPVLFSPSRVVMTRLFISNGWHFTLCRSPERTHQDECAAIFKGTSCY